jgi:hypothetical protein
MAASTSSSKGTKGEGSKPRNQRTTRKAAARRDAFRKLMDHAATAGVSIRLGISTADALQECLDRAVALFRTAAAEVDRIPIDDLFITEISSNGSTRTVPSPWLVMEDAARKEIESLASSMTGLGIAERKVRIEEAQAQLLVASIRDAAISVGIPHDQVRALGAALRQRVEEATTDIAPRPNTPAAAQTPSTSEVVGVMGPGH